MFVYMIIFLSIVSSADTTEQRSGFSTEYSGKNYTSLIRTPYLTSKWVDSKLSCLFQCLSDDGCSMIVFNLTNSQCMLYNISPMIDQELLPDSNSIVFVLQRTDQRKEMISVILHLLTSFFFEFNFSKCNKYVSLDFNYFFYSFLCSINSARIATTTTTSTSKLIFLIQIIKSFYLNLASTSSTKTTSTSSTTSTSKNFFLNNCW